MRRLDLEYCYATHYPTMRTKPLSCPKSCEASSLIKCPLFRWQTTPWFSCQSTAHSCKRWWAFSPVRFEFVLLIRASSTSISVVFSLCPTASSSQMMASGHWAVVPVVKSTSRWWSWTTAPLSRMWPWSTWRTAIAWSALSSTTVNKSPGLASNASG